MALYTDSPSFAMDKVQYQFPGAIVDIKVNKNIMFVLVMKLQGFQTEDTYELIEIDLTQATSVKSIPVPSFITSSSNASNNQNKMNLNYTSTPSCQLVVDCHFSQYILIMTNHTGDGLIYDRLSLKWKNLTKLKDEKIITASFCNEFNSSKAFGTLFVATDKGNLYQGTLQQTNELFKKNEIAYNKVLQIPENCIQAMHIDTRIKSKLVSFMASTDQCLYSFTLKVAKNSKSSSSSSSSDQSPVLYELVNDSVEKLLTDVNPSDNTKIFESKSIQKVCWFTDNGIFLIQNALAMQASKMANQTQFIPLSFFFSKEQQQRQNTSSQDDNLITKGIMLSDYHAIIYLESRIIAISLVSGEMIFETRIPENRISGFCADRHDKTFWIWTSESVYEILISNEDCGLPRLYVKAMDFERAIQFSKTDDQRDYTLMEYAKYQITNKKFDEAAELYAKIKTFPFENIVIRFLEGQGDPNTLIKYLIQKAKDCSENIQSVVLVVWIIHLIANLDQGEIQTKFKQQLLSIISKLKKSSVTASLLYEAFSSLGLKKEVKNSASILEDEFELLNIAKEEKDIPTVIEHLSKLDMEALYRESNWMLINFPKETIDYWLRIPTIQPNKLIPAVVSQTKGMQPGQQVMRLLKSLSIYNPNDTQSIMKYYIVQSLKKDGTFNSSLNLNDESRHFLLRSLVNSSMHQESLHICQMLGLTKEAFELALQSGKIDDAINIAEQEENPFKARIYWISIVKHLIESDGNMKRAFDLLKQTDHLKVEDLMQLLPEEFGLTDELKQEICDGLDAYEIKFDDMKTKVQDSSKKIQEIKKDIEKQKSRYVVVSNDDTCRDCKFPLLQSKFLVFPCHHGFHSTCFKKHLENSVNYDDDKVMDETDDNDSCPLCGPLMIQSIDTPFLDENDDRNDLNYWSI